MFYWVDWSLKRGDPSDEYNPWGAPNADHIACEYVEANYDYYYYLSHGESLGATTLFTSDNVKMFSIGDTDHFICYFRPNPRFLPGSRPGYTPALCIKKDYVVSHKFDDASLVYTAKTVGAASEEGYDSVREVFEPCPRFIPLIERAYRRRRYVDPYMNFYDLQREALLRLTVFLPFRDCPEVGIQGELIFGNDGMMYWHAAELQEVSRKAIWVGPYVALPELPERMSREDVVGD